MNIKNFYNAEIDAHQAAADATREALFEPFSRLASICVDAISAGNKLVFFGNGGSAADCQHIATELTIRYVTDRAPIAALALTTDTSALTAAGNDLGFENIFARQIEALCRPGDVAIAISTSGNSANIIRGLEKARDTGLAVTGFGGKGGGKMIGLCDPLLVVPSDITSRIQEMHITLGHMLCGALEQELDLI
ncbi:MAG: SIS domain-containing protein [Rhodospirillales bacterium]